MKTKTNRIALILSSVVCLLPAILSCIVYGDLPQQIAIHWDISGNPDSYVSKTIAAFGLPLFFLIINLLSKLMIYSDPKRANTSKLIKIVVEWLPPILSLILVPVTLFIAMGANIPINVIIPAFVGILLIITGNYLPKTKQNYTIGVRLPWTLNNADNWNKTNRMSGYLLILNGIIFIIVAFAGNGNAAIIITMTIIAALSLILAPILYSYSLYKKERE